MKNILWVIFLVAILFSCESATDSNTGDPQANQTWRVNSSEGADWIGTEHENIKVMHADSHSVVTDTMIINKPNEFGLRLLKHPSMDSAYILQFSDSTITSSNFDSLNLGTSESNLLFDSELDGGNQSFSSSNVIINYRYKFDCGKNYPETDTLRVYWLNSNQTDTARVYKIPIYGALQTVQGIMCGN